MQTVDFKPILFGSILNKFLFLKKSSNKEIKNLAKNIAVIDYNPETYKIILNNGLINTLKKNKGSFMVISNLQFAYVSLELEKHKFFVADINFLDAFHKIKNIDEVYREPISSINNFYDFFFYCEDTVNNVTYRNARETITLNKNGVIRIRTRNSSNVPIYLQWIITAYYQSQG